MSTDTKTNTTIASNGVQSTALNAQGDTVAVVKTISCSAPVAKVSIAPLKCKAAQCSKVPQASGNLAVLLSLSDQGIQDFSTLGDSMTTMLSSAIAETGCFTLLDREAMDILKEEMEMAGLPFQPETSDYVLTGAITSFEYATKKSGIGGGSFLAGAFTNKETTAKMGLDMRLINANSSRVDYTKTYRSDAFNDNYSFGLLGFGGGGGAAGGMSFGGSVEVEEAVRTVINQSVRDLIIHAAEGQYVEQTKEIQ
jgi:curli biogenesis system outer membrane secretion channel CsgG